MARKLRESAEGEGPAAVAAPAPTPAPKEEKKWLPLPLREDGTPDTDKLEPAQFTEKVRPLRLADGTTVHQKQQLFVKPGQACYAVNEHGELQAWYRKRGGVGRKLVYQFKKAYNTNTEGGKQRKKRDEDFRRFLRKLRIPGA